MSVKDLGGFMISEWDWNAEESFFFSYGVRRWV